jgi:hypothetical protein
MVVVHKLFCLFIRMPEASLSNHLIRLTICHNTYPLDAPSPNWGHDQERSRNEIPHNINAYAHFFLAFDLLLEAAGAALEADMTLDAREEGATEVAFDPATLLIFSIALF